MKDLNTSSLVPVSALGADNKIEEVVLTTMSYVKISQESPKVVLKTNFSKKCQQICTLVS